MAIPASNVNSKAAQVEQALGIGLPDGANVVIDDNGKLVAYTMGDAFGTRHTVVIDDKGDVYRTRSCTIQDSATINRDGTVNWPTPKPMAPDCKDSINVKSGTVTLDKLEKAKAILLKKAE